MGGTRSLSIAFLLALCTSFIPNDVLYWREERTLSWSDFQGRPQNSSPHGAISSVGISLSHDQRGHQVMISVRAFFRKRNSWVRPDMKTDEALKHEQGHFDIAEIYARMLRKEVAEIKAKGTALVKRAQRAHEAMDQDLRACQERYDAETQHHLNQHEQQKWNLWIAGQLQALAPYSSTQYQAGDKE